MALSLSSLCLSVCLSVFSTPHRHEHQASTGDGPGLTSSHSLTITVNAIPDPPMWSAPQFPLMAAEDEAMLVTGISLSDPDGDPDGEETRLRVDVWAEKGRVGLPANVNASSALEVGGSLGDDGDGDSGFAMTGNETALNLALAGLVYYPPPDWTSFKQVPFFPPRLRHQWAKPTGCTARENSWNSRRVCLYVVTLFSCSVDECFRT